MAFDGVTIANIVSELRAGLIGGRLLKIAQPEADELLLTIKTENGQKRLLLSADASLPLIYLTGQNKPSPMTAPSFCMLLRKHLQNGRILDITQPGLERVVELTLEHLNEMGDLCRKSLVIELMGKHSNIIFLNEERVVIDSIKRISAAVSSVREVLPGKPYFLVQTSEKQDALTADRLSFQRALSAKAQPLFKAIYQNYAGLSPLLAQELCYRAGLDGDASTASVSDGEYETLFGVFSSMMRDIREENFSPHIAYRRTSGGIQPAEYAAFPLKMYAQGADCLRPFPDMSELLEQFYAERSAYTRIRQKSADLRHIVQTLLERSVKKLDLQRKQLLDTQKRDVYRVYGELLNTYGYSAAPGAGEITVENYYTGQPLTIPLDPAKSATENAKRYFERYNKQKRTFEALSELTAQVQAQIDHLESISTALDIARAEEDLAEIREELIESGYLRRKHSQGKGKKARSVSKPFHYVSSDGFHIYVGKNNLQNEELTFKFAAGNDWWFHAKGLPGSHVIVKAPPSGELPDCTFEEAGRLAAYYSKGREQDKVEIDYIQRKHVKKPNGAKPGFVVYYTNYSLVVSGDIGGIEQVE